MKYMENAIMYLFRSYKIQNKKQLKFYNYNENVIMIVFLCFNKNLYGTIWVWYNGFTKIDQ